MNEEELRGRLKKLLADFIGEADWDGVEHPYWDEDTVYAMADAAMAVLKAVDATQRNRKGWAA